MQKNSLKKGIKLSTYFFATLLIASFSSTAFLGCAESERRVPLQDKGDGKGNDGTDDSNAKKSSTNNCVIEKIKKGQPLPELKDNRLSMLYDLSTIFNDTLKNGEDETLKVKKGKYKLVQIKQELTVRDKSNHSQLKSTVSFENDKIKNIKERTAAKKSGFSKVKARKRIISLPSKIVVKEDGGTLASDGNITIINKFVNEGTEDLVLEPKIDKVKLESFAGTTSQIALNNMLSTKTFYSKNIGYSKRTNFETVCKEDGKKKKKSTKVLTNLVILKVGIVTDKSFELGVFMEDIEDHIEGDSLYTYSILTFEKDNVNPSGTASIDDSTASDDGGTDDDTTTGEDDSATGGDEAGSGNT